MGRAYRWEWGPRPHVCTTPLARIAAATADRVAPGAPGAASALRRDRWRQQNRIGGTVTRAPSTHRREDHATPHSATVCVIGAGPSGLAAAKHCLQARLDVTVFEQGAQVGGNWAYSERSAHSSVYATTHIISSRRLSQYDDFPMPADWPDYPSHRLLQQYFERYAQHFGVLPHIRFRHTVTRAAPTPEGRCSIAFTDAGGAQHAASFDYLMVASGHHSYPVLPSMPGSFSGEFFHSHAFKHVDERFSGFSALDRTEHTCDTARSIWHMHT